VCLGDLALFAAGCRFGNSCRFGAAGGFHTLRSGGTCGFLGLADGPLACRV
jgi:hypothetical protein